MKACGQSSPEEEKKDRKKKDGKRQEMTSYREEKEKKKKKTGKDRKRLHWERGKKRDKRRCTLLCEKKNSLPLSHIHKHTQDILSFGVLCSVKSLCFLIVFVPVLFSVKPLLTSMVFFCLRFSSLWNHTTAQESN